MNKLLIGIPINEEKLYCFPVFLEGLLDMFRATTKYEVVIAFTLNSADRGIIQAIQEAKIPAWILPAPRRKIQIPPDHVFMGGGELAHITNITLARNILREAAMVIGAEWLFYLDSDGVVEPNAINRLMCHKHKIAACMWSQRAFDNAANPIEPVSWIETLQNYLTWEDVKDQPAPIVEINAGFGGCLIHNDVFRETPITFTMKGKDVLFSEDTTFYKVARNKGVLACCDQFIETIHFMNPNIYPYGHTNRNEVKTYEEFNSGLIKQPKRPTRNPNYGSGLAGTKETTE